MRRNKNQGDLKGNKSITSVWYAMSNSVHSINKEFISIRISFSGYSYNRQDAYNILLAKNTSKKRTVRISGTMHTYSCKDKYKLCL